MQVALFNIFACGAYWLPKGDRISLHSNTFVLFISSYQQVPIQLFQLHTRDVHSLVHYSANHATCGCRHFHILQAHLQERASRINPSRSSPLSLPVQSTSQIATRCHHLHLCVWYQHLTLVTLDSLFQSHHLVKAHLAVSRHTLAGSTSSCLQFQLSLALLATYQSEA